MVMIGTIRLAGLPWIDAAEGLASRLHHAAYIAVALVGGWTMNAPAYAVPQATTTSPMTDDRSTPSPFRLPADISLRLVPEYRAIDAARLIRPLALREEQIEQVRNAFRDYERTYREDVVATRAELTDVQSKALKLQRAWGIQEDVRRRLEALQDAFDAQGDTSPGAIQALTRDKQRVREEGDRLLARVVGAELTEDLWPRERRRLQRVLSDWETAQAARAARLRTALEEILDEEQVDRLPSMFRAFDRKRLLPLGRIPGESLDLAQRIDEQGLALSPSAQATFDAYLDRLDAALTEREMMSRSASNASWAGEWSLDDARAAANRLYEARSRVATETRSMVATIEASLDDETASAWRLAVREAMYPRLTRRTAAERQLLRALEIPHLGEGSETRIVALLSAWRAELGEMNSRLMAMMDRAERAIAVATQLRQWGFEENEGMAAATMEIDAMMKQRSLRGMTYVAQLRSFLTPDQLSRLSLPPLER